MLKLCTKSSQEYALNLRMFVTWDIAQCVCLKVLASLKKKLSTDFY